MLQQQWRARLLGMFARAALGARRRRLKDGAGAAALTSRRRAAPRCPADFDPSPFALTGGSALRQQQQEASSTGRHQLPGLQEHPDGGALLPPSARLCRRATSSRRRPRGSSPAITPPRQRARTSRLCTGGAPGPEAARPRIVKSTIIAAAARTYRGRSCSSRGRAAIHRSARRRLFCLERLPPLMQTTAATGSWFRRL